MKRIVRPMQPLVGYGSVGGRVAFAGSQSMAATQRNTADAVSPNQKLLGAAVVSAILWIGAASTGALGQGAILLASALLCAWLPFALRRGKTIDSLVVIAYLAAVQPGMQELAPSMPYLFLSYLLLAYSVIFFIYNGFKVAATLPLLFYSGYMLLEVAGLASSQSASFARGVLVPSLTVLMCAAIASRVAMSTADVRRILAGFLIGAFSMAALILRRYVTASDLKWGTESNSMASGGMGPNQMTILLAAGAFLCFIFSEESQTWAKWGYYAAAAVLTYLMMLTFSRGGLYILTISSVLYYLVLRPPSSKTISAMLLIGILGVGVYVVASGTSQGKINERYSETDTTNRDVLAGMGWQIFLDNAVTGVGTGNFYSEIEDAFGEKSGAHNEFTRAAAEHGVLGLFFWIFFVVGGFAQAARGRGSNDRDKLALRVVFMGIAVLTMLYNGLKMLLQPFFFLMAFSAFSGEYASLKQNFTTRMQATRLHYTNYRGYGSSRRLPRRDRLSG